MSLAAAALVATVTGGCAGAFDKGETSSPLTPRIAQLTAENRVFPRWRDFPQTTPPPAPSQVGAHVNALRIAGDALSRDAARLEWTPDQNPTAFAEAVNRRIDAQRLAPVTAATRAEVEAFADAARRRAEAPPPIPRH